VLWAIMAIRLGAVLSVAAQSSETCAVCGLALAGDVYVLRDEVTFEKKPVCQSCALRYPICFLCGLPARTNLAGYLALSDGRSLCARDAQTAVLQEQDGLRLCAEVKAGLDRLFSRFLALPGTNVAVTMVDRVHLQELFKFAGHDYTCPNVWGYLQSRTNHGRLQHQVHLMTGLPPAGFQATCAHEFGHAWISQNVPDNRRKQLRRNTEEGFCELLAYLYVDSLHEESEKTNILRNTYTRGQVQVFIAAEQQFGINDILEWLQFGVDPQLAADQLDRIRTVEMPLRHTSAPPSSLTGGVRPAPPPVPTRPILKAIFWDPARPLALINDRTFAPGEEGKIRLAESSLALRCLSVQKDRVRIKLLGSGEEQELILREP